MSGEVPVGFMQQGKGSDPAVIDADALRPKRTDHGWSFDIARTPHQMDPRLQRLSLRRKAGLSEAATFSSLENEINVIARVKDTEAWFALSEVRASQVIGGREGNNHIVTARIPVDRIDSVRGEEFVESLKAAQPVKPVLKIARVETHARPEDFPTGIDPDGGLGVVVGIVDYGCDFAHENFLNSDGTTRLEAIWDQGGTPAGGSVSYGREFLGHEINQALQQPSPYDALGYGPAPDTASQAGTHGTHVMDIAAGNGNGTGEPGFAPKADLIFVHVAHEDIPFRGPNVVNSSFGDSVMLLEAVQYIFDKAGDRPCVINLSLGTNGGPKDGSTLVEEGMDRLLRARSNRAITIAASNSYDDGIHAEGSVVQGGITDIKWEVPVLGNTHDEFELWYGDGDLFAVELLLPNGDTLGVVEPGNQASAAKDNGDALLLIVNRIGDPNNGDNQIGIFLEKGLQPGQWTIRLHGRQINGDGKFHAWIERDNYSPSRFSPPNNNSHTLGSISTGNETLVVGSYDASSQATPLSWFSSAGPTRDGREKPEISAPGHHIAAAHSRTVTGSVSKSGTSMAAPAVCGIIALMLAQARSSARALSIGEIRQLVIAAARDTQGVPAGWHPRYGFGRIDASSAVQGARDLVRSKRDVS